MSRRRRGREEDPVARAAIAPLLGEIFDRRMDYLKPIEVAVLRSKFGYDDAPQTSDEIARSFSVSRAEVLLAESIVISRLRHPSFSTLIRDFLDGDYSRRALRESRIDATYSPSWHQCSKHGQVERLIPGPTEYRRYPIGRFCPACGCPIKIRETGRPAKYCESSCRQAHYRFRKSRPPSTLTEAQKELAAQFYRVGYRNRVVSEYFAMAAKSLLEIAALHTTIVHSEQFLYNPERMTRSSGGRPRRPALPQ